MDAAVLVVAVIGVVTTVLVSLTAAVILHDLENNEPIWQPVEENYDPVYRLADDPSVPFEDVIAEAERKAEREMGIVGRSIDDGQPSHQTHTYYRSKYV